MGADSSCALKSRMAIGEVRHVLTRSEEHTSELQSRSDLVCRLLLEKKKNHSTPAYRRTSAQQQPKPHPTRTLYTLTLRPLYQPQYTPIGRCESQNSCNRTPRMSQYY